MAHLPRHGTISEFSPELESFSSYVERVQIYMDANDVKDNKKRAVFLSVIGVNTYTLLRDLVAPADPRQTHTIAVLRQLFAQYGLPNQLVSDNGPQFTSEEFSKFLRTNGVRHVRSAPYHPERFVKTFKQAMKATEHQSLTLAHRLSNFLLRYRTTPHSTTNKTPSELFLRRIIRTRLNLLMPTSEYTVLNKQTQEAQHHDIHTRPRSFEVGQHVMAQNFLKGSKWKPTTITKLLGNSMVLVKTADGQLWKRHLKQIGDTRVTPDQEIPVTEPADFEPPPLARTTASTSVSQSQRRYPGRIHRPPERLTY